MRKKPVRTTFSREFCFNCSDYYDKNKIYFAKIKREEDKKLEDA